MRNLAAGGAILAAGVLASIGFRRLLQQRRRKPTRRIPMPAGESAGLERQLRATTNPTGLALLDRSLRSMAARAACPPERSTGIVPVPTKNSRLSRPLSPRPVKYSCFATNVTRRRTTSGMKIESQNERWLPARIAPSITTI